MNAFMPIVKLSCIFFSPQQNEIVMLSESLNGEKVLEQNSFANSSVS